MTLVEMMIAVGISAFIILGVIGLEISSLKNANLVITKLTAATGARQVLNAIRDQVRCAQQVQVGTYVRNGSPAFTAASNGAVQQGNALQIYSDSTGTNYSTYYLDTTLTTNTLFSVNNGVFTSLAKYATNYNCFFVEDYRGNVQTNYINNPTIHVVLQFNQWEFTSVGGDTYNNYRLETRVSRRIR